ncbi:MAG: D-inositol-3-phosphate glycosyltransferase [Phycisphaerae bacterium]|nr:D-inositol-3-phosphate glycosyltransferase [Phycisphaerae bacterium]
MTDTPASTGPDAPDIADAPDAPPSPADRGFGILHLVDADCSPAVCSLIRLLTDRLGATQFPQRVLALGDGPHRDWLARYDLPFEPIPLRGTIEPARSLALGRRLLGGLEGPAATRDDGGPRRPVRLVHAHSPRAALMAAAATIGRPALARVPLAIELYRGNAHRELSWVAYLAARRPGWEVNVIARSQELRKQAAAAGFGGDHVGALRPPLEMGRINRVDRAAVRAELGIEPDAGPVLLAGGWCRRDEDQKHALWAAAVVNLLMPNLRIVVPGDGPVRDTLQSWIANAGFAKMCRFPGRRFDWPQLVAAADLLVHASGNEVETTHVGWAMAAGVPVVAAATTGVCELLEDHHNALLAQPYDPRDMARQVRLVLTDAALRAKLADQGRHEAFHYFNPSDVAGLYKDFYLHFRLQQLQQAGLRVAGAPCCS